MGNFDNYYIDGNGNKHKDIPLGTSPADAYVRTNMKLKKEVQRIDNAIQEVSEHIDTEISRVDEAIVNIADRTARQLENAANDMRESINEVSESIDTKIASELAGINNRVDNIIAHNNDTEGNSELIDIRTSANGITYNSAGDAVREQMNSMNSKYSKITCSSRNLADIEYFTLSKSGETDKSFQLPENLPSGTYTISVTLSNVIPSEVSNKFGIRYFDEDNTRTQIAAFDIESGRLSATFTAEKPVASFLFFLSLNADQQTSVTFSDIQVESGETASTYMPPFVANDAEARAELSAHSTAITSINTTINNLKIYPVSTAQELADAVNSGGIIFLRENITVQSSILISSRCIIYGNGHSITGSGLSNNLIQVRNTSVEMYGIKLYSDTTYNIMSYNANIIIENSVIHQATDSVCRFTGTSNIILKNCDIGYSSGNDGISAAEQSSVYVYNCYVHDNFDEGISTHNSSYCEVHGGEYCRNGYVINTNQKGAASSFGGIHIGGGKMGIVEGAYSHHNCTYGIGIINFQVDMNGDIEKVWNNIIENNGGAGVWLTGARGLTLSKNTILNNGGDAIHFGLDNTYTPTIELKASSGVVADNTMYGNLNDNVVIENGFDGGLTVLF